MQERQAAGIHPCLSGWVTSGGNPTARPQRASDASHPIRTGQELGSQVTLVSASQRTNSGLAQRPAIGRTLFPIENDGRGDHRRKEIETTENTSGKAKPDQTTRARVGGRNSFVLLFIPDLGLAVRVRSCCWRWLSLCSSAR